MNNVACIIARTNSTRLPRKVLKPISGLKMIEHIIARIKKCKNISKVFICTSHTKEDYVLKEIADNNDVSFYAGSEDSVIDRMIDVADLESADNVIRITGDNIFTDGVFTDLMLQYHIDHKLDYTRTEFLPVGITSEIIKVDALKKCYNLIPPNESQYLMLYMFRPDIFDCGVIMPSETMRRENWSLTVDTKEDWERTVKIFEILGCNFFDYDDILDNIDPIKIPHLEYSPNGIVKLPSNMVQSFKSFQCEMTCRREMAKIFSVSCNEYKAMKNEQRF